MDFYGFFYHALPEEGALNLSELHDVVRDVWLTRFDQELEQERAARRKGRPKSATEMKLEEIKLRETSEYRTGIGKYSSYIPVLRVTYHLIPCQRSQILLILPQSSSSDGGTKKSWHTSICFGSFESQAVNLI